LQNNNVLKDCKLRSHIHTDYWSWWARLTACCSSDANIESWI